MTEILSLLGTLAFFVLMAFLSKWLVPKCRCLICEWNELLDTRHQIVKQGGLEDQIVTLQEQVKILIERKLEITNTVSATAEGGKGGDNFNTLQSGDGATSNQAGNDIN